MRFRTLFPLVFVIVFIDDKFCFVARVPKALISKFLAFTSDSMEVLGLVDRVLSGEPVQEIRIWLVGRH